MSEDVLIELDERRRVSFGKLGHHRRYIAHEEPDGTLVLQPAVVLTEAQAGLNSRPDISTKIDDFLADPASNSVQRKRSRRR